MLLACATMCYFIGAAIVYFNSTDSVVDDNNKDIEYQRSYKCDDHQMLSFNEYGNKSYYFIRPTLEVSNFEVQAFDFKEDGKFANGMINYYCVFIGVGFYTYSIEPSFWLLKYTINTGGIRAISHTPTLVSIPPPPPPPKKKKKKKKICVDQTYILITSLPVIVLARNCANTKGNKIVPIAVGAALAGLVVVVLIAYLIGRLRSRRQSSYEALS